MHILQGLCGYARTSGVKRLLGNAGWMLGGSVVAAAGQIVATAILARALDLAEFGVFVLTVSFVQLIEGICNPASWQPLIRHGSRALARQRVDRLRKYVRLAISLDLFGGICGLSLAFVTIGFVIRTFEWSESISDLVAVYAWVILVRCNGAAIGVLRLTQRFQRLAFKEVLDGSAKLVGTLVVLACDGSIKLYVIVWVLAELISNAYLATAAYIGMPTSPEEARTRAKRVFNRSTKAFLSFAFVSNFSTSIDVISKRGDTLAVGAVLGSTGAAGYRILKLLGQVAAQLQRPLYQAIYPQLSIMHANRQYEDFRRLILLVSSAIGTLFALGWALYVLFGRAAIEVLLGESFVSTWLPGVYYLLGVVIAGLSLPFQPAALALGYPTASLRAHLVSNLVFFPLLIALASIYGLLGAGISFIAFYACWALTMGLNLRQRLGEQRRW